MKQLLIVSEKTAMGGNDISTLKKGQIRFATLSAPGTSVGTKLTEDFSIALGRGENLVPFIIPEVNFKTLTVTKSIYEPACRFQANVTVPAVEPGLDYTLLLIQRGKMFNERNTWTVTERSEARDNSATVANRLVDSINNNPSIALTAGVSGTTITITGSSKGEDYSIVAADALDAGDVVIAKQGHQALLDAAYVKDLALQCAAGKGFKYLDGDGKEIYPGFPEEVPDTQYVMFTLRFAVPRVSAKQRDEVVYQLVHIVVESGSDVFSKLKTILDSNNSIPSFS